ncbi:MAG: hypothetical protein KF788_23335 [Piscinibacter sp.]|nr:hypothetical protein [Piscinibacter sp.]
MFLSTLLRTGALLAALLPAAAAAAPEAVGRITILDGGDVSVLRGTQRFAATEGLPLHADDIVGSGDTARLARLELSDGTTLDLGPATELLLRPTAPLGGRAELLYLARGWLKVGAGEAPGGLAAPGLERAEIAGNAVLRVTPQAVLVFAESGAVLVDGRARLRDGDAWVQRTGSAGLLQRRPPKDLMQGLPRAFVDTLPHRLARFEKAPVEPGPGTEAAYAEVAHWLNAEAPLRSTFVRRFAARARDREFRAGLVAELRAHPEWDRTLFPEKYRPKPVVVVRRPPPPEPAASSPAAEPAAVMPVAVNLHGQLRWPGAPRPDAAAPTKESP